MLDDVSRECLALIVDTSISGLRVARELDQLIAWRGRPTMIVSDNGTDLERDPPLDEERAVEWHDIAPGKPAQNALPNSAIPSCDGGSPELLGGSAPRPVALPTARM